jgi:nucleoside-diphosphate-sugar epimerase
MLSLVGLDNLVSFIIHCIEHPKSAHEIFLVSDGEDVSTTQLLKKVANAFGKKAFLLPIPVSLMKFVAKLISKEDVVDAYLVLYKWIVQKNENYLVGSR